jgi:dTDP-4-dehydrorhamnose reductase
MSEKTNKTLLLTGATGFLGTRLTPVFEGSWRVARASRSADGVGAVRLDLLDPDSIRRAFDLVRPDALVHAGAEALPDPCERDPERARRVNTDASRLLAELCGAAGIRMVHFSTDLVFDGEKGWYDEDDRTNPLSVYGRTKLAAEEAVLSKAPGSVVLRVSTVYGRRLGTRACFVDELRDALSAGKVIGAFVDQWRSPTDGDGLGEVVLRVLADPDIEGVRHWGGAERATRFETAVALCRAFGFDERLVHPTRAADKKFPAPRPRDTSLNSARLAAEIGLAPAPLADGLAALKAAA